LNLGDHAIIFEMPYKMGASSIGIGAHKSAILRCINGCL
jgi:hypothetical protein